MQIMEAMWNFLIRRKSGLHAYKNGKCISAQCLLKNQQLWNFFQRFFSFFLQSKQKFNFIEHCILLHSLLDFTLCSLKFRATLQFRNFFISKIPQFWVYKLGNLRPFSNPKFLHFLGYVQSMVPYSPTPHLLTRYPVTSTFGRRNVLLPTFIPVYWIVLNI